MVTESLKTSVGGICHLRNTMRDEVWFEVATSSDSRKKKRSSKVDFGGIKCAECALKSKE